MVNFVSAKYGEWKLINTTGGPPKERYDFSMIYDSNRDRIIIHAGRWNANLVNDLTWAISLTNFHWYQIGTNSSKQPKRLEYTTAVINPDNDTMIVYGGYNYTSFKSTSSVDVFNLSTFQWTTNICDTGLQPQNYLHRAFWYKNKMIIHGGYNRAETNNYTNLLIMTNNSWRTQVLYTDGPKSFLLHSAILLTNERKIIIFGGFTNGQLSDALYSMDIQTFTQKKMPLKGDFPHPLQSHTGIYDSIHHEIIIYGGKSQAPDYLDNLYVINLDTFEWREISQSGQKPSGRYGHCAVYVPERKRMYVFGGRIANNPFASDQLYELSLNYAPEITGLSHDKNYGDITFTYNLIEPEGEKCSIRVEYRGGSAGGSWKKATISGHTNNIFPGQNKTFIWHMNQNRGMKITLSGLLLKIHWTLVTGLKPLILIWIT